MEKAAGGERDGGWAGEQADGNRTGASRGTREMWVPEAAERGGRVGRGANEGGCGRAVERRGAARVD